MVYNKQAVSPATYPTALQQEATRAAFRQYSLTHTLTPKFLALINDLQLVDTKNSSIRCQGQCKNGGRCSQRINRGEVERAILQLQTVALDCGFDREELEEELGVVFEGLLCGSAGHCTKAQVKGCAARARPIVEAWRERWVDGQSTVELEDGEDDECKRCVELETDLSDVVAQVYEVVVERDELRQQVDDLTIERDDALSNVDILRVKYQRLRESRDEAVGRTEDLAKQLQTLQIKHDGLMGRMATEVEQHQHSSTNSTPAASASGGNSVPLSKFAGIRIDGDKDCARTSCVTTASKSWNEQSGIFVTPCPTPSSPTLSPSPSFEHKSLMTEVPTLVSGSPLHPRHSIFANLSHAEDLKTPTTTKAASPFANLSVSGPGPGILGIGNTTPAGRPHHQAYIPRQAGLLTPQPTPERDQQRQQKRGDLFFKADLLQVPHGPASPDTKDTVELATKPPDVLKPRKGTYNFFPGVDSSAEVKPEGTGKEKAPFGFTVRKRES